MQSHPFSDSLSSIDPRCQIVTPEILADHLGGKLAVTAITASSPGREMMAIDIFLHPEEGGVKMSCPYQFPIVFAFSEMDENGLLPAMSFGAGTCHCASSMHEGNRWNPCCVAIVWFEGLQSLVPDIARAFRRTLVERNKEFCVHGMRMLFGGDYQE